ncbi:glycosyltransferase [Rouxiella sp. WC2420]|uniref:Glycosyltransferase n=1 Tax=Rouxiella sp. WC2420 TaxID=3234145 RepID=A0AB39VWP5_9GAMM
MEGFSKPPLVSIYISTCNRVRELKRAISSVLKQDFTNFELLICDDASTDETEEYVNSLIQKDNRIRYFRNRENKGACATRNLGIFSAKGKYITGLDDDDEFCQNRVSLFLKNWRDEYSFICANFFESYPNDNKRSFYKVNEKNISFDFKDMLFHNVASNQVFTLTNRLKEIGGFDESVKRLQDWDTWLRLSYQYGGFLRLPQSTYIMHHDHEDGAARVSKSAGFSDSLILLSKRNKDIYKGKGILFMRIQALSVDNKKGYHWKILWGVIWKVHSFIGLKR